MSDRVATVGIRAEFDGGQARADFDRMIKELSAKPVSVSVNGTLGGQIASTLSGTPVGQMPAGFNGATASQNLAVPLGSLERAVNQLAGIMSRVSGGGVSYGPGSSSVAPTTGTFAAPYNPAIAANLARTRGSYGDPAAALNQAISGGADAERLAYPASPSFRETADAAGQQAASGISAGPGGGRGGPGSPSRFPFNRLISHFAGGYAVYSGINAAVGYGRDLQLEQVAANSGNPNKVLAAQQQTYQNAVGAFGILGSIADYFTGGSVGFAQDNQDLENARSRLASQNRTGIVQQQSKFDIASYSRQRQIVATRNEFDRQKVESDSRLQEVFDARNAEITRRNAEIRNLDFTSPYDADLKRTERHKYVISQNRVLDAAQDLSDAEKLRIEGNRKYTSAASDNESRTSISSNFYAAGNNSLAASLSGVVGNIRSASIQANHDADPKVLTRALAEGVAQAFRDTATTSRGLGVQSFGLETSAEASALLLKNDPLGAQRLTIEHNRQAAQAVLPSSNGFFGRAFDFIGGSRLRTGIDADAASRDALAVKQFGDTTQAINLNQSTRQQQANAMLTRNPVASQFIGIAGSAEAEALSLRDRPDQARAALNLGLTNLKVASQDYRYSFTAESRPQNFETGSPRGQQDYGTVMAALLKKQDELIKAIQALGSN